VIVPSVFVFCLLAVAKSMKLGWRTVLVYVLLSAMVGLTMFSFLTVIPQLSDQALGALPPETELIIFPLIFIFELISGTYIASRILRLDYMRFLKLTLISLFLTSVASVPISILTSIMGL